MSILKPLQQFICDGCGTIIEEPKHAEIIWNVTDPDDEGNMYHYDYSLVHRYDVSPCGEKGCGLGDKTCNAGIEAFMDCFLLQPQTLYINKFQDLMFRLSVPYYEQARQYRPQVLKDFDVTDEMFRSASATPHYLFVINKYSG